jgi:hypothetical protein
VSKREAFREEILSKAIAAATSSFNAPSNPLRKFPLKGKTVFCLSNSQDDLVLRQIVKNIKRCLPKTTVEGRSQIVANLRLLLTEGVPFRVYRLDVRSFYESFNKDQARKELIQLKGLSPQTRTLIDALLNAHENMGGLGIPRGLSLSAILSDFLMTKFDQYVESSDDCFYYSRYVDDIIIMTSTREKKSKFIKWIEAILPEGLSLNPNKKDVVEVLAKVKKVKTTPLKAHFSFDYLGYKFTVYDRTEAEAGKAKESDLHRSVSVDIANRKIKKIKTRVARAFHDFSQTSDWGLLQDRIAFLTQNFSVFNTKAGGKKLAGIYHSYPLVDVESDGLRALDRFLRNAVLSKSGRIFSKSAALLSAIQKRKLLRFSFVHGHSKQSFIHFSSSRISNIQNCWKN